MFIFKNICNIHALHPNAVLTDKTLLFPTVLCPVASSELHGQPHVVSVVQVIQRLPWLDMPNVGSRTHHIYLELGGFQQQVPTQPLVQACFWRAIVGFDNIVINQILRTAVNVCRPQLAFLQAERLTTYWVCVWEYMDAHAYAYAHNNFKICMYIYIVQTY